MNTNYAYTEYIFLL